MTPEVLAGLVASILSLLFKFFPKLNTWYAGLESTKKQWIMIVLLFITGAGVYGLSCVGAGVFFGIDLVCETGGFLAVLKIIFALIASNQFTYMLVPEPAAVTEAKDARVS